MLDKVTLGVVLHVVSTRVAVFAYAESCVVGCCTRVAPAHAVLCMVSNYVTVTERAMSYTTLGMLSQFGCCIRDAEAAAMAVPPKFPEAKSRGLADLLLIFGFPKEKLKRVFVLFGLC